MTRLIEAEALAEALEKHEENERNLSDYQYGINDGLQIAEMELEDAPTIDAVPVVRCKDCEGFDPDGRGGGMGICHWWYDDPDVPPDGYCHEAERREEK